MRIAGRQHGRARVALSIAALASTAAHAADDGALEVAVGHAGAVAPVIVQVTIRNAATAHVSLLRRHLPERAMTEALLDVLRDGQPVRYIGLRASRPPPAHDDHRTLAPGAQLTLSIDLSSNYDLSVPGMYHVRYDTDRLAAALRWSTAAKRMPPIVSRGAAIALDAGDVDPPLRPAAPAKGTGLLSFHPACTPDERTALNAATIQARQYARLGVEYFALRLQGARYAQWFGAYDPIRYDAATARMLAIDAATRQANLEFECIAAQSTCPDSNVVAYVSPMSPHRIYVCPHLYDYPIAPAPRGYAQSGAVIHEISHFVAVGGGTDDFIYGYAQSAALAATRPADALRNADSWMYYAMNQPDLEPYADYVFRDGFD